MGNTGKIKSAMCDFEKAYEQGQLPAVRDLERRVFGVDYGGTSWTTRPQVDQIVAYLELRPGVELLEIGAGSGWPGLYLARLTGCAVTLIDTPLIALELATKRASQEGLEQLCRSVAGSGAALPFKDRSFDALSHSDVLCCMPEKFSMLRECRRVGRQNARMNFSVIFPAASLSATEHAMALAAGPPFVEVPGNYGSLLSKAGWRLAERVDATGEYLQSLQTLVENMAALSDDLVSALGEDEFTEQHERRLFQIRAVERGLLKRAIFLAVAS